MRLKTWQNIKSFNGDFHETASHVGLLFLDKYSQVAIFFATSKKLEDQERISLWHADGNKSGRTNILNM